MKKFLLLFFISLFFISNTQNLCFATDFGRYKPETEYGLIDGFKFNGIKREKNKPMFELRSETPEEKMRLEREKTKPTTAPLDENEQYRFMQEGTVVM